MLLDLMYINEHRYKPFLNSYTVQMHSNSFNQLLIIKYLDCFYFFTTISGAAVNILIQVNSLAKILGQKVCIFLVLISTDKLTSRKTVSFTLSLSTWVWLYFRILQNYILLIFLFHLTKLIDDKWCLIFICEVDFLSISLPAFYLYFLSVCFPWPLSIFL